MFSASLAPRDFPGQSEQPTQARVPWWIERRSAQIAFSSGRAPSDLSPVCGRTAVSSARCRASGECSQRSGGGPVKKPAAQETGRACGLGDLVAQQAAPTQSKVCISCPKGTWSDKAALVDYRDCAACPAGTWGDKVREAPGGGSAPGAPLRGLESGGRVGEARVGAVRIFPSKADARSSDLDERSRGATDAATSVVCETAASLSTGSRPSQQLGTSTHTAVAPFFVKVRVLSVRANLRASLPWNVGPLLGDPPIELCIESTHQPFSRRGRRPVFLCLPRVPCRVVPACDGAGEHQRLPELPPGYPQRVVGRRVLPLLPRWFLRRRLREDLVRGLPSRLVDARCWVAECPGVPQLCRRRLPPRAQLAPQLRNLRRDGGGFAAEGGPPWVHTQGGRAPGGLLSRGLTKGGTTGPKSMENPGGLRARIRTILDPTGSSRCGGTESGPEQVWRTCSGPPIAAPSHPTEPVAPPFDSELCEAESARNARATPPLGLRGPCRRPLGRDLVRPGCGVGPPPPAHAEG